MPLLGLTVLGLISFKAKMLEMKYISEINENQIGQIYLDSMLSGFPTQALLSVPGCQGVLLFLLFLVLLLFSRFLKILSRDLVRWVDLSTWAGCSLVSHPRVGAGFLALKASCCFCCFGWFQGFCWHFCLWFVKYVTCKYGVLATHYLKLK